MAGARVVLTYRDYAELPDDGRRYEIHDGELSVTPAPSPQHQDVVLNLAVFLRTEVSRRGQGKVFIAPIDVILSNTSIVQPDIVFVAADRLGLVSGRAIEGAPTLVVEILSPSTRAVDRQTKMQLYARHGISLVLDRRFRHPCARSVCARSAHLCAAASCHRRRVAERRALPRAHHPPGHALGLTALGALIPASGRDVR